MALTPISMAPSTTSKRELSPCSCPRVRGRPRSFAQRPLPSITIATCRGTRAAGTAGGNAPEGWGVGRRTCRLALDRTPGSLAFRQAGRAGAEDLQLVTQVGVPVLPRDAPGPSLHRRTLHLDGRPADPADEVVVVG